MNTAFRIVWLLLVLGVSVFVLLMLAGAPLWDWWLRVRDKRISEFFRRRRDLSRQIQEHIDAHDVTDLPRRTPMQSFADFADIVATMPDLDEIDKQVAGLYLVPQEESS